MCLKNFSRVGLKKIAIDLLPILSNGENGGAKIFTKLLVANLATQYPDIEFKIYLQPTIRDELYQLKLKNLKFEVINFNKIRISSLSNLNTIEGFNNIIKDIVLKIKKKFLKKLNDSAVDLLFSPMGSTHLWQKNIPMVSVFYDMQYFDCPGFFTKSELIERANNFSKICKYSSYIASISEFSRSRLLENSGVDGQKVRTIYIQTAKPELLDADTHSDILSRFHIFKGEYLIYPANFWAHKNHEMLLVAFNMAISGALNKNLKLVFTGVFNSNAAKLKCAASIMNLEDRIIFTDYLPREELLILLANAKALIYPSLYEGFGMPIVEAMALGVPIICSKCPALLEVSSNVAFYFDEKTQLTLQVQY